MVKLETTFFEIVWKKLYTLHMYTLLYLCSLLGMLIKLKMALLSLYNDFTFKMFCLSIFFLKFYSGGTGWVYFFLKLDTGVLYRVCIFFRKLDTGVLYVQGAHFFSKIGHWGIIQGAYIFSKIGHWGIIQSAHIFVL